MISTQTLARRAALRALVRAETSDFFATDFAEIESAARPFARELYSGTQRHRALLDYQFLLLLAKKSPDKLDAPVRAALRLAAYEFYFQNHPIHAVGNAYVELLKSEKLSSASGFLNAILRGFKPERRPFPKNGAARLPIEFSHPRWLVDRYLERLGETETEDLLRANNSRAPLCLRVNTTLATREGVLERLENARAGQFSPNAIVLEGGFESIPRDLWDGGALFVQDEAAQLVSFYAAPKPGDFVLDLTGAPGGKATHLAQMVGETGRVLVCDASEKRLEKVRENAARLRLKNIETVCADARELEISEGADLVLLDAPCLGTGTFRRRPDAKWRKTPEMLGELVALQAQLLEKAANFVRPGGALVYSTCSLESEENSQAAARFSARNAFLTQAAPDFLAPLRTPEGFLHSWPHRDGVDGMFAAKWKKK